MRMLSRTFCASVATIGLIAFAPKARGQSFGTDQQVLAVSAAAFHPTRNTDVYHNTGGYVYGTGDVYFVAPLDLPEGAEILQMCVYGDVPVDGTFAMASIDAHIQAPGGATGGSVEIRYVSDAIPIGYGVVCTDPFSFTLRQVTDINNDGTLDNVVYVLQGRAKDAGFGGVRIFWRRQVSPPPGVATFNDVPTDHPFFQFVEALAASGITAGCGGNNFCPDAPITRKQMAAFLAKALGLHWATY